jgi:hypothetical protein
MFVETPRPLAVNDRFAALRVKPLEQPEAVPPALPVRG